MRFLIIFLFSIFLFSKNVLILNSYSVQFPWTKGEIEGILKNLKNRKNIKLYIEFMDTKLFAPTPKYLNNFYNYLEEKYKNIHFDVIITTDDNALNFVLSHKNGLFRNSKIFFAGVNNLSIANSINRNEVTGVFEKKEPLANLNFLRKSIKNLKKVYVVADNSNSAKAVMKEYKKAFKNIKNLKFIYINESDLNKVLNQIKNYNQSGMLLLTPFRFKLNNSHINYKKAIKLISKVYKMPIVIHTDILANIKNSNIIGGKVTDSFSQGNSVSRKVIEYLNGEKLSNIPLTYEKANKMYLNVKHLEKFNINIKDLNYKNAILVNRPLSVFEMYKKYIIATGVVLFALIVVIFILLIKNYKLKKQSENMLRINKKLEEDIKEKFNTISQNYSYYLEIKTKAILDILNLMLKNIKTVIYEIKNKKECEKSAFILENVILFGEESLKNSSFSVKKRVEEIIEILKNIKFYNNVYLKGDDFQINLDKILFTELMIQLIKEKCTILLENKKIIIIYKDLIPESIKNIKEKIEELLNIKIDLFENKIVLSF